MLQDPAAGASFLVVSFLYWLGYLPRSVFQEKAPSCVLALSEGGMMVLWLVHWTLHLEVQIGAMAADIVLCFYMGQFTLEVPLPILV